MTQLEVLGFHRIDNKEKAYFIGCFQFLNLLDINGSVIDKAIFLRQQRKMSLGDAIIAATALYYNATVLTRNVDDFSKINDLKVINPVL